MLEITNNLRPNSLIPPYPNYHTGDYFEEFFFKKFVSEFPNLELNGYKYIPIFWTNCYTNNVFRNIKYDIQNVINSLDKESKYFTISQHDDCIYENLPKGTKIFSMGGNRRESNIIPIPLLCSPIKYVKKPKNIKVSFVGSLTHPIRELIYNEFKDDDDFVFKVKQWELENQKIDVDRFIDTLSRSYFSLSPRGYGATSFRMYESLQMDAIPIYVFDEPWLPWQDEIEWSKFSILVQKNNIKDIKSLINNCDYDKMIEYKNYIYNDYFTYGGVYTNIIKKVLSW